MTYKELIELLKEIQDDCHSRINCENCKFNTIEKCAFISNPEDWKLELLYIFPKQQPEPDPNKGISIEDFGEALEILEGSGNNGEQ